MKKALSLLLALALCLSFAACGENSGGHTCSGEWVIWEAATCFKEGTRQRTCSCGKVETESIPALTHAYKDGICELCNSADPNYKPAPTSDLLFSSYGSGYCYVSGIQDDAEMDVVIPETSPAGEKVVGIEACAFMYSEITSVWVPEGVNQIKENAFSQCKKLTKVVMPNSLLSIDNYAFDGCNELQIVSMGSGVTTMGSYVFRDCFALTQINLPNTLETMGTAVFMQCESLKEVTIPNGLSQVPIQTFNACSGLERVTLGECVETIGPYTFKGCTALKQINIPDRVSEINSEAFSGCTGLAEIEIPAKTKVHIDIFDGCTGLKKVKVNSLVPLSMFSDCTALEEIIIPEALTEIYSSEAMWQEYADLLKVEGGGSIERKSSEGLEFSTNKDGTCKVIGIGSCTDTVIVIPKTAPNGDKVVAIGVEAFDKCYQIKQVIIPETVTEIGYWAFMDCSGLTSLDLPESVTTVSSGAFYGCASLTTLTIRSKTVVVCPYYGVMHSAGNNPNLTALYVPAELVDQYKTSFNWATIADVIYPIS